MSTTISRNAAGLVIGLLLPTAAIVSLLLLSPAASAAAPRPDGAVQATSGPLDINQVLLVLAVVVAAAHLTGALATRLGQPRVIGQVGAGLLLGPSVLGQVFPAASTWLQGGGAATVTDALAQLGVVLFAFLIGLELSGAVSRRTLVDALTIGQIMTAVPIAVGVALAVLLVPGQLGPPGGPSALFIGLALGATALPVLAHILLERQLMTTRIGATATTAAAIGDATLWCLLAVTITWQRGGTFGAVLPKLLVAFLVAASMWWLMQRNSVQQIWTASGDHVLPGLLLSGVLACAVMMDDLGLNLIFGALLAGLIVSPTSRTVRRVSTMVEGFTEWMLLPVFFMAVGQKTNIGALSDWSTAGLCILVVVAATLAKTVAGGGAARIAGFSWRDCAAIGVMVNCRGLTELVLLNLGLTAGLLDSRTFTIFVVMALVTTAATGPLLNLLGLRRPAVVQPDGGAGTVPNFALGAPQRDGMVTSGSICGNQTESLPVVALPPGEP